jgi:hypothetical protein
VGVAGLFGFYFIFKIVEKKYYQPTWVSEESALSYVGKVRGMKA